jgi:MFS family permease
VTTVEETAAGDSAPGGGLAVFRNGGFLRLWMSQAATQIGGNMVLFGLTVIVVNSTSSNTAVALLVLSYLVPAVLFSAVAGVYVDRLDRRLILVMTNVLRGAGYVALFVVGPNFPVILLLNFAISTISVFFAPAELAMIPVLVPRNLLLAANGVFTVTLNAAFALGFALLGPLVVNVFNPEAVILVVAALYFLASLFCFSLPSAPPETSADADAGLGVADAEAAVGSTLSQLQEGIAFVRANHPIAWSLLYLGITASLIGVLGVLGPAFAKQTLGLAAKDFAVVVLPLGFGIVTGILLLNSYGRYFARRRVIEGGMIALGVLLGALSAAGPISRLLQRADAPGGPDLSIVTSLLSVVVVIAFFAGMAYGLVAIPSQTQLQEDLPEDVRGRVFGILMMVVSVASFLPIIIIAPISDLVGTTAVIFILAIAVLVTGVLSVVTRGPLQESQAQPAKDPHAVDPIATALLHERPARSTRPVQMPPATSLDGAGIEVDAATSAGESPGDRSMAEAADAAGSADAASVAQAQRSADAARAAGVLRPSEIRRSPYLPRPVAVPGPLDVAPAIDSAAPADGSGGTDVANADDATRAETASPADATLHD